MDRGRKINSSALRSSRPPRPGPGSCRCWACPGPQRPEGQPSPPGRARSRRSAAAAAPPSRRCSARAPPDRPYIRPATVGGPTASRALRSLRSPSGSGLPKETGTREPGRGHPDRRHRGKALPRHSHDATPNDNPTQPRPRPQTTTMHPLTRTAPLSRAAESCRNSRDRLSSSTPPVRSRPPNRAHPPERSRPIENERPAIRHQSDARARIAAPSRPNSHNPLGHVVPPS